MSPRTAVAADAAIARRVYAAWNLRDWRTVASLLAPDVEWLHLARGEAIRGVDAVVHLLRSSADAFPHAHVHVCGLERSDATLVARCTFLRAGEAPPGDDDSVGTYCDVLQIEAGRVARGTTYGDPLSLLLDLDAPTRPSPADDGERSDLPPSARSSTLAAAPAEPRPLARALAPMPAPSADDDADVEREPESSGIIRCVRLDRPLPADGLVERIAYRNDVVIRDASAEPAPQFEPTIRLPIAR